MVYGEMMCDYPGCSNPIRDRCTLCGRAMCIRHIRYVPVRDIGGIFPNLIPAHYKCQMCDEAPARARAEREAARAERQYQRALQAQQWEQRRAWERIHVPAAYGFSYNPVVTFVIDVCVTFLIGLIALIVAGILLSSAGVSDKDLGVWDWLPFALLAGWTITPIVLHLMRRRDSRAIRHPFLGFVGDAAEVFLLGLLCSDFVFLLICAQRSKGRLRPCALWVLTPIRGAICLLLW